MQKTKIFFVDDHAALRDALAGMINDAEQFQSVGVAGNGREAIIAFKGGLQTDIVLLDLNMPEMDGYETAEWLAQNHPEVKIVVMTMGVQGKGLIRLLVSGVMAILSKDASWVELCKALDTVRKGHRYFSESVTGDIAVAMQENETHSKMRESTPLTENEREFIRLCTTEFTYKEIGHKLGLSHYATEALRSKVFEKLNTSSRYAVVMYAVRAGIVEPGRPG